MTSAALESLTPSIAHLRSIAMPVTDYRVLPFGLDAIDKRLAAGGLRAGALQMDRKRLVTPAADDDVAF